MPPKLSKKKMIEEYEKRFKHVMSILSYISEDRTTPRNIRRSAKEALKTLTTPGQSHAVRAVQAINILDDVSQDPNMPAYTRTRIWNIVSLLEIVKE